MPDDPIVSEVRRHRTTILESHGGDLRRYHEALQQDQVRRFGAQLVVLEPHRIGEPSAPSNRRSAPDSTLAPGAGGR
jgi:hypothetical protein